ncbi:MAG: sulfotransferase [Bacteroidota bacterium]|nr:sulfotransferase [Bacteroidota bacterium]
MHDPGDIPIFFIIGRPRSGTTLLLKLFDAHPNVIIPWECQYIVNLYPKYGKIAKWSRKELLSFYYDVLATWQFKVWSIDSKELKKDILSSDPDISYADLCKKVHLSYQSLYPKEEIRFVGDKNHGYTIYIAKIKEIYPEAKFIYINRDYRDHFYSIKNVDFELPSISVVTYKWKHFFRKALQAKEKYPDSIYILRYEDLVKYPQKKFGELCDFIGLNFDDSVMNFHRKKDEHLELFQSEEVYRHHKSLMQPLNTKRIGLWKKHLSAREVRIADCIANKYAEKGGYIRIYDKCGFLTCLLSLPGIFYAKFLYIMTHIIDHFPYKLRALLLNKGPLFLARMFMKISGRKTKA